MEVEVKYPLKNPEQVITRLNSIAKLGKVSEFQKDTYFELDLKLVRIRETKASNFIGYKERIDEISCNNYCSKVGDVCTAKKILSNLGFKEKCVVEKVRSTWFYKDFEIAIDKIKGFGWYVEIEAGEKNDFTAVLRDIGAKPGPQDFKGYSKL